MERVRKSMRPSPAMLVAIAAMVLATVGYAVAVPPTNPNRNDEVTAETTTGGPTESVDLSDGEVVIPIADPTFTQRAGEVALVSVDAQITGTPQEDGSFCDLFVGFFADTGGEHDLGFELVELAERGDPTTKSADSQALPPPGVDREVTMHAFMTEAVLPDEQGNPQPDEGQCDDDEFTVTLNIAVTTLRG